MDQAERTSHCGSSSAVAAVPAWTGRLVKIYISKGHDYWGRSGEGRLQSGIDELKEIECVAGMGLRGDRYFGTKPGFKGQVTFFDQKVVDEMRQQFKLAKLPASVFRRNLIVSGVDLSEWLGKRFCFQNIEFEGAQECHPCHWMDRVVGPGAAGFMKEGFRGGLRARIHGNGFLSVQPHGG
ncbi:molybdenum cofactor biosysynthesis protein [Luteolibacter sp. GHJ8]|uniref:Molybdenum cofactor biosysynthesis protein n=1 Tax=Luteolibacter rhizosphaerae TaxID=2989719 RepID=A0ABT3G9J6_9BACT|nr:MOSC domain-containing protein [Luteolibacter rhizosphaerae]MCW1915875.1 molybdenum cofactor biosysynthesis protein [Luteolibacter rhizosphaerae]